jgi:hypothetical protein
MGWAEIIKARDEGIQQRRQSLAPEFSTGFEVYQPDEQERMQARSLLKSTAPDDMGRMDLSKTGQLMDAINRGTIAGTLGAPADIGNEIMRPFGYGQEKPFLGSEWFGDKMQNAGMVSANRNPVTEGIAGFIDPLSSLTAGAKLGMPFIMAAIPGDIMAFAKGAKAKADNRAIGISTLDIPSGVSPDKYDAFSPHIDSFIERYSEKKPDAVNYAKRSLELGAEDKKHKVSVQFGEDDGIIGASSRYIDKGDLWIDTLGSVEGGAGVKSLLSAISESKKMGKDGAVSLMPLRTPEAVSFYDRMGFTPKPGNEKALWISPDQAMKLVKEYGKR